MNFCIIGAKCYVLHRVIYRSVFMKIALWTYYKAKFNTCKINIVLFENELLGVLLVWFTSQTGYKCTIMWQIGVRLFQSLQHFTGPSAAALPRCLSIFRATRSIQNQISQLRYCTRSCGKTSYHLMNWGPFSPVCQLSNFANYQNTFYQLASTVFGLIYMYCKRVYIPKDI